MRATAPSLLLLPTLPSTHAADPESRRLSEDEPFAVPLPGSAEPGYSATYVNAVRPELEVDETMYDLAEAALRKNADRPCLGWRPWDWKVGDFEPRYHWITYREVAQLREALGSGLMQLLDDGTLDASRPLCAAFWAANRPEFQQLQQAANTYSFRTVALYDAADVESGVFILHHAEAQVLVTTHMHARQVIDRKDELPDLKVLVIIDAQAPPPSVAEPKRPPGQDAETMRHVWEAQNVAVMRIDELIEMGRMDPRPHRPPKPEDVAQLVYTSGTTGKPKAVMITQRTKAFAVRSTPSLINFDFSCMLGYLPVAHSFACMLEDAGLAVIGGRLGYSCGDTRRILDDLQLLQPDVFPTVPRVLNRIAAKIQSTMEEDTLKARVLRYAVASKLAAYDASGALHSMLWDRLVFNRIRALMGGRVKLIISGSAPCAPSVLRLLRVAMACPVIEGYGMTENYAIGTVSVWTDKSAGTVGPPMAGVQLRLKDKPDMGYCVTDPVPRGELMIRGQCVFKGFLKAPEQTAEVLDADGWLASGDIAEVDSRGRFSIIDRAKALTKLSQGEYVSPEKLEMAYTFELPIFHQLVVYGNSLESFLVAVGSVDKAAFSEFVRSLRRSPANGAGDTADEETGPADKPGLEIDVAAACNDSEVIQGVVIALTTRGRKAGLNGVEMIKNIRLYPTPLAEEMITPTFKVKRNVFARLYKSDLDQMYAEGPVATK